MTTIAWRDGVLVADKKASDGDTGTRVTKLLRTKKYAIAFAGNLGRGLMFAKWLSRKEGKCPLDKDTDALVMDLDTGKCYQYESDGHPIPIEDRFASIGSGSGFALGAMSMGATAEEAVEVACEWDNCSGLGMNIARSRPHIRAMKKKKKEG
jgi:20S proteasome alpha/beta subunit